MKFVKANLLLVILGAIVLLAIVAIFWPLGSWTTSLQADMKSRYDKVTGAAKQLANTDISIPGYEPAKGVPSPEFKAARAKVNERIKKESEEVVKLAAEKNRTGRVDILKNGTVIPLLNGEKLEHVLPVNDRSKTDPMVIKDKYETFVNGLAKQLTGSDEPGTAPDATDVSNAYTEYKAKQDAAKPPGMAGFNPMAGNEQRAQYEFTRNRVLNRAASIQMYVDANAFQVRPWLADPNPPNEQQIFNALIDSWFQLDVIHAINAVNKPALDAAAKRDPKLRNVGSSPIKRLMHITVGSEPGAAPVSHLGTFSASSGGGTGAVAPGQVPSALFVLPTPAAGADAAAAAAAAAQPNTPDPLRSLTGRASGAEYDVVLMTLNLELDPAYLNVFIDSLYRQNMGYTVLNMRTKAVDPLDRISAGYIYGDTQVIEVELVVEGLLFRNWTSPIMPQPVRDTLGLGPIPPPTEQPPAPPADATPAPAATPAEGATAPATAPADATVPATEAAPATPPAQ